MNRALAPAAALVWTTVIVRVVTGACAALQASLDDDQTDRSADDHIDGPTRVRLLADAGIPARIDRSGQLVYLGTLP